MSAERSAAGHPGEGGERRGAVVDEQGLAPAPGADRPSPPAPGLWTGRTIYAVVILLGINTMNFYDRQVLGAVGEAVKKEWDLSDTALASLTTAFVLLYAAVGLPLGYWADTGPRKLILSVGVVVWTLFTGLSGLATSFAWLFVYRLGVGVGEASCAPAANSLLGDLFPPRQRARAMAIFMLGLPLGLGASLLVRSVSSHITDLYPPASRKTSFLPSL